MKSVPLPFPRTRQRPDTNVQTLSAAAPPPSRPPWQHVQTSPSSLRSVFLATCQSKHVWKILWAKEVSWGPPEISSKIIKGLEGACWARRGPTRLDVHLGCDGGVAGLELVDAGACEDQLGPQVLVRALVVAAHHAPSFSRKSTRVRASALRRRASRTRGGICRAEILRLRHIRRARSLCRGAWPLERATVEEDASSQ